MKVKCIDNLQNIKIRWEESYFSKLTIGEIYEIEETVWVYLFKRDNKLYKLKWISWQFLSTRFEEVWN